MKKAFVSILLSAAIGAATANAAEPTYSWTWTESGLSTTGLDSGWDTFNSAFGYTLGDDYATISGNNQPSKTSGFGSFTGDFTLSFDLRAGSNTSLTGWKTLASISSWGVAKEAHSLQLQTNGTNFILYNMNNSYGHNSSAGQTVEIGRTGAFSEMTDWVNLSIVSDVTNGTLTFYVDGTAVGSVDNWGPRADVASDNFSPTGLVFGCAPDGGRDFGGTVQINNIKFYNSAVASVPEPATATLSLLALAGLAARRYRK